ncbi:MAG: deoxyribose-phosphate aldolase [Firmicutes bacterium]|nr:deoxyribose-phosphate aldolase [Bacillota bacterium]
MDVKDILMRCDHTLLSQSATWEDIKALCDDGLKYRTASVCIPPCFVKKAKEYVGDELAVCTVIGFPNGYNATSVKSYEARKAIEDGADEIDMVINVGAVKAGDYDYVLREIKTLREVCGSRILKVIIETCLLSDEEKLRMCEVVTEAGADYIKTSTGFSTGGATFEDVKLLYENVGPMVKVKASGGIKDLDAAAEFIRLGADRLGTSRVVKAAKALEGGK